MIQWMLYSKIFRHKMLWATLFLWRFTIHIPDNKIHGANMGPNWVLSAPDGPMLAQWTLLSEIACPGEGMCSLVLHHGQCTVTAVKISSTPKIYARFVPSYISYRQGDLRVHPYLPGWVTSRLDRRRCIEATFNIIGKSMTRIYQEWSNN